MEVGLGSGAFVGVGLGLVGVGVGAGVLVGASVGVLAGVVSTDPGVAPAWQPARDNAAAIKMRVMVHLIMG